MCGADTSNANPTDPEAARKRKITERRRAQCRAAQQAYRNRQKKKLEALQALETKAQAIEAQDPSAKSAQEETPLIVTPNAQTNSSRRKAPAAKSKVQTDAPIRKTTADRPVPTIINLADAFVAAGDLPIEQQSGMRDSQVHIDLGVFNIPTSPEPRPAVECIHEDYGDIDMAHIWPAPTPSPTRIDPRALAVVAHSSAPSVSLQSSSSWRRSTDQRRLTYGSFDPYINHLHLFSSTIEAMIAISRSIGVSRNSYIQDHPSHFPSCYAILINNNEPSPGDPGWTPRTALAVSPSGPSTPTKLQYTFLSSYPPLPVSSTLMKHIKSVPYPLRPSPTQLVAPHPTYLDAIIFPFMRDRAVQAASEGKLAHEEFFTDIAKGGLVCWGGSGNQGWRGSQAWSTRSWEAKPWFLMKWKSLVGTEEEEKARGDLEGIWTGSRWWWAMRGDYDGGEPGWESGWPGEEGINSGYGIFQDKNIPGDGNL